jgi:hypothetical protein
MAVCQSQNGGDQTYHADIITSVCGFGLEVLTAVTMKSTIIWL